MRHRAWGRRRHPRRGGREIRGGADAGTSGAGPASLPASVSDTCNRPTSLSLSAPHRTDLVWGIAVPSRTAVTTSCTAAATASGR